MTFKVGDRVKRVELLQASMSEYFGGEPFNVVEAHPTYVVDPNGGHHGYQFLELVEGPIRTVTRQEIVPGTYDGVEVGSEVTGHPQREVMVRIAIDHGPMVCMDADQLDRAAAVLTALAGALRDEQ